MNMTLVDDYAQRLLSARGDLAEYDAAQKVKESTAKGDVQSAEQWRRVREKIRILRGPHVS